MEHSRISFSDSIWSPEPGELDFDLQGLKPSIGQLFVRGTWNREVPWVSVVGSRQSDTYGNTVAYRIGNALARVRIPLCTGGARGIDSAAIQGALDGGGVVHIVFGTSLKRVLEGPHRDRMSRVLESGGSWISEHPEKTRVRPYHFRNRNRIIAALSHSVVVVQAARKSGSLSTARWTRQLKRTLFAVPGDINKRLAAGTNDLLSSQKARPLIHLADLLKGLPVPRDLYPTFPDGTDPRHEGVGRRWGLQREPERSVEGSFPISPRHQTILETLAQGPMGVEECALELGWSSAECRAALEILELEGRIRCGHDHRFSLA